MQNDDDNDDDDVTDDDDDDDWLTDWLIDRTVAVDLLSCSLEFK